MKLIIDIGGTRGRWYIVNKSIISSFETEGFNPFTSDISVLRKILYPTTVYGYGNGFLVCDPP